MSDKDRRHIVLVVKGFFKGQQAKHEIDAGAYALHPPLPPSPHRRTDIVNRRDACRLQGRRDAQIEIRGIDTDKGINLLRLQTLDELIAHSKKLAQTTQHLDQPHDRQTLHRHQGFSALGEHLRAGNANEACVRITLFEGPDEPGTQKIAGGLTSDDAEDRSRCLHDRAYRMMPRVEARSESMNNWTSGVFAASSASGANASSSVVPSRKTTL